MLAAELADRGAVGVLTHDFRHVDGAGNAGVHRNLDAEGPHVAEHGAEVAGAGGQQDDVILLDLAQEGTGGPEQFLGRLETLGVLVVHHDLGHISARNVADELGARTVLAFNGHDDRTGNAREGRRAGCGDDGRRHEDGGDGEGKVVFGVARGVHMKPLC